MLLRSVFHSTYRNGHNKLGKLRLRQISSETQRSGSNRLQLLDDDERAIHIHRLESKNWTVDSLVTNDNRHVEQLSKTFEFKDFNCLWGFATRFAMQSHKANHHANITISSFNRMLGWLIFARKLGDANHVTLTVTTVLGNMQGPAASPILYSFEDSDNVVDAVAQFVLKAQKEAVEKKDSFTVAISGGSLPKMLRGLIASPHVKWDKWHIFYADERVVTLDHPDSNHALCKAELYDKVAIPAANIHVIDVSLLDNLENLADDYEKELIKEFAQKDAARFPIFDLILLGMGPDGHTASLFPGHDLLAETDRWIAYIEDSPKPPPKRITLTLPVINHAARVAFVATGAGKVDILCAVLDDPEAGLPSARVKPVQPGQVYWFTDAAATAKVQYPTTPFSI